MDGSFEDLEMVLGGAAHRLRISSRFLESPEGERLGRVLFFKEISHEPLRRKFEELVVGLSQPDGALREEVNGALTELANLGEPGMYIESSRSIGASKGGLRN